MGRVASLAAIRPEHRHVFLSPHYDDAVFSCGGTLGLLAGAGHRPLVITIFGGGPDPASRLSPTAVRKHQKMGMISPYDVEQVIARRRTEDAEALGRCGSDYLWLDHPDALYRGDPPRYPAREDYLGGDVHPADLPHARRLTFALTEVERRVPGITWYAPLAACRS